MTLSRPSVGEVGGEGALADAGVAGDPEEAGEVAVEFERTV